MKTVYASAAALTLLAGTASAADAPVPALAPAKPAGLKRAQDEDTMTAIYVVGGGALVAGIALLASDNGNAATTPPAATTTATST